MSDHFWYQLPSGFLKKTAKGWARLDWDLRELIVELAYKQNFQCAFCNKTKNLIIEHDHWPDHGDGEKVTIYNLRGLACHQCNWHLGMYEADQRGNYRGFDDAYIRISDSEYEPYIYAYERRIHRLFEDELERRMGALNYWRRYKILLKFDDWREWGLGRSVWTAYSAEVKERRRRLIRTPTQFWKAFIASARFVIEEKKRNPDFEIPEQFVAAWRKVQPMLDEVWPNIEAPSVEIKV